MLLKAAQNSHSFVSAACAAKTMLTSLTTRRFFSARGKKKKIEWFDSRNSRLGEWTVGILERRCSGLIRSCWRDSILFICLFWANWHWKLFPSSTYVFFPSRLPHWRQEQNLMKSPDITSCLRLPKPPPKKNLQHGQKQQRRLCELCFATTTVAWGFVAWRQPRLIPLAAFLQWDSNQSD